MNFKKAIIFLLILIIVVFSIVIRTKSKTGLIDKKLPVNNSNITQTREYWSKTIDEMGRNAAYEELKKEYANKPLGVAHRAVHVFGEVLYAKFGLDAIYVCDDAFLFGCYHSVMAYAVSKEGLGVIQKLNDICAKKYGDDKYICHHGIGHGILGYLGYNKLLEALKACEPIQKHPIFGCDRGVFMEYETFELDTLKTGIFKERKVDPLNPYGQCKIVPEKYQLSCYYDLPNWWLSQYNDDYVKLGELCQAIGNVTKKKVCLMGIGHVAAQDYTFNVEKVIKACDKIQDYQDDLECRVGAVWRYYASYNKNKKKASLFCAGLKNEDVDLCLEKALKSGEGIIY